MKFKITVTISRNIKSDSCKTIKAYNNQCWDPELSESVQSLRQGFLELNRRLRRLEAKLRKV